MHEFDDTADTESTTDRRSPTNTNRRRYLAGVGALGLTGLAGCLDWVSGQDDDDPEYNQIGSGRADRELAGTPIAEMPDLEGTLEVYSGRDQFLVGQLFEDLQNYYDDFTIDPRYESSTNLVNKIRTEGENSPADVFFTVNVGALGLLAGEGYTQALPDEVLDLGREGYQDPDGQWIGTSGRARTVPYNTDELDESDVPDSISEFPETDALADQIGWAPTYGSCQDFVTAMRMMEGDDATREWLEAMVDHGVREYGNEFQVAQAVADGELLAGLTNHYYVVRVLDNRNEPPIDMTYTDGDAASFFNVAGAAVMDDSSNPDLAANFVRHLLSAEAQDYFAVSRTFEYPMIPEVEPIEELPSFDDLETPDLDLQEFTQADVTETEELMRDAGAL
ncbi:extracellular solute-binding protein [Halomontanus rarus]|uniref:extracellular solute-binding protein n=1 Tax=Halomontanus rarus TaxID=3034020 RepID=UPI001A99C145